MKKELIIQNAAARIRRGYSESEVVDYLVEESEFSEEEIIRIIDFSHTEVIKEVRRKALILLIFSIIGVVTSSGLLILEDYLYNSSYRYAQRNGFIIAVLVVSMIYLFISIARLISGKQSECLGDQ